MKILVTSIVDLKKSQHNRPHQFVKYLSKNHDITVLSINDWWKGQQGDLESYSSFFNDFLDNVDYHYLTDRKISPILQEVLFKKKIKEISKKKFDVHLNYNSPITGYRMSEYFKTVLDLADDLTEMIRQSPQIPEIFRSLGGLMGDHYIRKAIEKAEFVTLTTEEIGTIFQVPSEKATVIPNGVDTDKFYYQKESKENLGLDGFIIGYVGVLREWVDFKPVFQAFKYLDKSIKLLIVGSEGRLKENKALAKELGVYDRVIFTGMVPYSEVPKYVSAMDIGIIPFDLSKVSHNALPIKLFEYMSSERPVISTELTSLKTMFPYEILFVNTYEDYLNKIKLIYDDSTFRKKLGKNGKKIAEQYDWRNITIKLENVLLQAAGEK